ncbi:MAG: site-specific DNA-methyltransferase [Bacteroidales bacterium]|nr:site-specific DNA-methyltransferase [Bacteroidales bacterium]
MNKTELARKIKALEGLDNEEKTALLDLLRRQKKYGLVWEEKTEDIEERLRNELPVLIERNDGKVHSIISDNPDAPNHLIIEGDNLAALTELSYTTAGQVDIIYIDPPYNRGENDFKYNDTFVDKDNPFKHSLWLNFMSKRLKAAKTLLCDTGIIVIHIDEHEYNALYLLLDEIFSSNNNLGTIVWNKMNPKGDAKGVASMHEYIIIFAKSKENFLLQEGTLMRQKPNAEKILAKAHSLFSKLGKKAVPDEIKKAVAPFGYGKELLKYFEVMYDIDLINKEFQNWLSASPFSKGEKAYKYISPTGRVFRSVSMAWPNKETAPDDYWIPLRHPETGEECPIPSKGWRNPSLTMNRLLGSCEPYEVAGLTIKGEIVFSRKRNGTLNIPERIYYLDENMFENVPSLYNDGSSDDTLLKDLNISFEYPKTVSVASYLLKNIHPNAHLIIDFFAGSGTTLHAVMALNAEDGGKRQCILCTNNEKGICENVTYERNKRVIEGYTKPNGEEVEGLSDNNLRYYRTEFIPRERSVKNMRDLVQASTGLLCVKNNLYTEAPFAGKKLNSQYARYFEHENNRMLIIYEERAIPFIADIIKTMPEDGKIKIYVFSHGSYAYDDDFVEVADRVTLCALPQAIYDAYQKVLPKRKAQFIAKNIIEENTETEQQESEGSFAINEEGGDE